MRRRRPRLCKFKGNKYERLFLRPPTFPLLFLPRFISPRYRSTLTETRSAERACLRSVLQSQEVGNPYVRGDDDDDDDDGESESFCVSCALCAHHWRETLVASGANGTSGESGTICDDVL